MPTAGAPRARAADASPMAMFSFLAASLGLFSPPDLDFFFHPPPAKFDKSTVKPASMKWREWCDPPGQDDMDVPLSNRSLALMRDTPWLQLRAATLDSLEFSLPNAVPMLWRPGSSLLDVGAAFGVLIRAGHRARQIWVQQWRQVGRIVSEAVRDARRGDVLGL